MRCWYLLLPYRFAFLNQLGIKVLNQSLDVKVTGKTDRMTIVMVHPLCLPPYYLCIAWFVWLQVLPPHFLRLSVHSGIWATPLSLDVQHGYEF